MGWTHLLFCALVILAAPVAVGFLGFDAAWVTIAVAFNPHLPGR
jgi:hypothetical protein